MKKLALFISIMLSWGLANCQVSIYSSVTVNDIFRKTDDSLNSLPDIYSDTLTIKGDDYLITHYHKVSSLVNKKLLSDFNDDLFSDTLNKFSRLIFESNYKLSFNIPTIPLTNIIYLKKAGLIVGLSKIVNSPYHIVIYSTDGTLLCKRSLQNLELKLNRADIKYLLTNKPKLKECFSKNVIVKDQDNYYLELSRCLLSTIGKDSLLKMNKIAVNKYFPFMSVSKDSRLYSRYNYSFSDSAPFYDLVMVGSVPYLLILNSEDGTKINIPLVSNCAFLDF